MVRRADRARVTGRKRPPPKRATNRAGAQRGLGGEQVEGRHAVAELLAAGRRRVSDVWLDATADGSPALDRIVELAAQRRVPVRRVPRARLDARARSAAPQGVLAHADPVPEADFGDLCSPPRSGGRRPFLVALDGVTDPQNLGALLRSADGAGATGVVLSRHRSVHLTPAVTKAAAGAVEHVPIAVVAGLPNALSSASRKGLWVVGLDPGGPTDLFDLPVADQAVIVVLGAEGRGLSPLCSKRCDVLVHIRLRGALPSLSVAAAGAVALFEIARKRET